jgi:hypothetical protein
MLKHGSFPERAAQVLIAAMVIGIVMIAQRYSVLVYRWGLGLLVGATLLQIAVGNLPADASAARSVALSLAILAMVLAVFTAGVWLVPVLSHMGR